MRDAIIVIASLIILGCATHDDQARYREFMGWYKCTGREAGFMCEYVTDTKNRQTVIA